MSTIDELRQQLADVSHELDLLRAAGQWVSVCERLPEYNENVLVCFETVLGTKQITTAELNNEKRCGDPASNDYDDIWYVTVGWGHKVKPTHWMPLSSAPSAELKS